MNIPEITQLHITAQKKLMVILAENPRIDMTPENAAGIEAILNIHMGVMINEAISSQLSSAAAMRELFTGKGNTA